MQFPGPAPARDRGALPSVWTLLGRRHGDNAQVQALALDTGLQVHPFYLDYNALRELPNALLGGSLASLRRPPTFGPPWPDLVIGIGRRSVPAARWIKAQSGGRTRLVHLGRPRVDPRHFDLVITTPQYGLPDSPNVLTLNLPYQARLQDQLESKSNAHSGPVLVVLGGDSWSLKMTGETIDALAAAARAVAAETARPLVATTSPRTPVTMAARFAARLGPDVPLYDWARERGAANPYRAYLDSASQVVMTGDSVSGLADAVWTGRPVTIVPVPEQPWLRGLRRIGGAAIRRWLSGGGNFGIGAPPPDMEGLYRALVSSGLAEPGAHGQLRIVAGRALLAAERRAAAERVRALC